VGLSEGLGAAYWGESCWRCREGGGQWNGGVAGEAGEAGEASVHCIGRLHVYRCMALALNRLCESWRGEQGG